MADIDDRWHRRNKDGELERTDRYGKGARWLVRWRDPSGNQRKKSFKRKSDAEKFAVQIGHGMLSGSYVDPAAGKITLEEWSKQWLSAQAHVKPTSLDRSQGIVRNHVVPRWGTARSSHGSTTCVTRCPPRRWSRCIGSSP